MPRREPPRVRAGPNSAEHMAPGLGAIFEDVKKPDWAKAGKLERLARKRDRLLNELQHLDRATFAVNDDGTNYSDVIELQHDHQSRKLVPERGIEPPTFSLRMSCSTD